MTTSEEYLASLGIDTSDLDKAVNSTITLLGHLGNAFDGIDKYIDKAERSLQKIGTSGKDAASGVDASTKAANRGSKEWQALAKTLADAQAAYKQFRKEQLTGEGGGTGISDLTKGQQQELVAIYDAANASIISDIRKQQSEQERASAAEQVAVEKVMQAKLAANAKTYADTQATIKKELSLIDQQTAAYVQSYTKQYQAADEANAKAAAAQQARRYATPTPASRNTANPSAMAEAQAGYSSQELASMNAYYANLEKTSAATAKAQGAARNYETELPRLRYALYDVSFAAAAAGAGLIAGGVAVEAVSIKYEALYADVVRTSKGLNDVDLGNLRGQLLQLTSEIPSSFGQITEIATLGNQLNIPDEKLASFTKTVAQFAATTDSSVEAAATDFGRLGEILNTTNYRELGDDIAYLGVNAVATETQIAKTAQQIAVSTQAANFGVGPTLALATALASLGIKPEQARGSILRTFSQINASVAAGGEQLNDLAAISGKTSSQFASQWKNDASGAFTDFLKGLQADSGNLDTNLAAIGVTATRDRQTLGLLSQNLPVLEKGITDLANANGYLDKSFGVVAETAQSKLTIVGNNFQRIMDTIGQSTNGPVKGFLDGLNDGLEKLNSLLQDPAAAGGVALSLGITALIGVIALAIAAFLRFAATAIAIRTASTGAAASQGLLAAAFTGITGRGAAAVATVDALAASEVALGSAGGTAAAGQAGMAATSTTAAAAGGKLAGILGKAGLVGSLLALIPLIPAFIDFFADTINKGSGAIRTVDDMTKAILGLNAATGATNLKNLTGQLDPTGRVATGPAANQTGLGARGAPQMQTSTVSGAAGYYQKLKTGSGPTGGGAGLEEQAEANIKAYDAALAALIQNGNLEAAQAGIDQFHDSLDKSGLSLKEQDSLLPSTTAALGSNSSASLSAAAAAKAAAQSTDDANSAFATYIDSAFGAANASRQLNSDLGDLGAAFVNDGAQVAGSGAEIQAVISDIYASANGSADAAGKLQGFFNALIAGGYASASQLSGLQAVIFQLTGGKGVSAQKFDVSPLATGFNKATAAAQKTAAAVGRGGGGGGGGVTKQVRTLIDYANDLSTVFKRAFDIRYGGGQALDTISKGWSDIRKNAADAADAMAKANATIQSLGADKAALEYWLTVANAYGDTLRAADIQAELTQNALDTADAQKDLQSAQDATNKTLVGNSDAAIENRSQILGLVQNYESYIQALAASGVDAGTLQAKSAQLKAEFLAQAQQLGYNSSELGVYAASFDDVSVAISKVPRNITVTANVNPAIQALNELAAKAASVAGSAGASGAGAGNAFADNFARALDDGIHRSLARAPIAIDGYLVQGQQVYRVPGTSLKLYRSGGWTGGGNADKVVGGVHAREFVLNETGAQQLPMSVLNAMNQGRAPILPSSGGSTSFPSTMVVELSAADRQILADGKLVTAVISAQQLVGATGAVYASGSDRGIGA